MTGRHLRRVGVLPVAVLLLGVSKALLRGQRDVVWRRRHTSCVSSLSHDVHVVLWPCTQSMSQLYRSPAADDRPPMRGYRRWSSFLNTDHRCYCGATGRGHRYCGGHGLAVATLQTKFQQVSNDSGFRLSGIVCLDKTDPTTDFWGKGCYKNRLEFIEYCYLCKKLVWNCATTQTKSDLLTRLWTEV